MKLLKKVAKLSKKEKYLLTCSYGPDSMALFWYLLQNGFDFEIAHVNYHILKQADDDENGIKKFASKYNIKVNVLSVYMPKNVNEEIWARGVRYKYFEDLAKAKNISNILVAHNEGDHIETYILQKNRGGEFLHYGLEKIVKRNGVKIIRPLLKITKKELEEYCKENNVPYSIDPSNFDTKFQRNAIRQDLLAVSEEEKKKILHEIKQKNLQNSVILRKYKKLGLPNYIDTNSNLFANIDIKEFQLLLIYILKKKNIFTPISLGRVENLFETIRLKKSTHHEKLEDDYYLFLDYGVIRIVKKPKDYSYKFNSYFEEHGAFKINSKSKKFNSIADKFPLTIKPALEGKEYVSNKKTLKVNRQFTSRKLPYYLRPIWPGIYDKYGELIYVPRYQKNVKKNGLLIFKTKRLLN